jgi:primosomal protein N' (replication factor Y)
MATFLRAASPANQIPLLISPERETAVYPERLTEADPRRGDALIVPSPAGPADIAILVAPEGSTIVIDPSQTRAARLAVALRDEGREVVTVGSEHSAGHRTGAWDRARAGACVVIGGRTAVWAPVPDLATIIVLDEADEALEDERAPTWNARDVAVERARRVHATVRLVTPAPTVDAVVTVGAPAEPAVRVRWPRVQVVDQRDEEPGHGMLSSALADALHRVLDAGERAVCVLNRTGRARLLACNACRELARCERCGATVQQRDEGFLCAHCDTARPLVCLHCHGGGFRALRPGIGRVREDLAALLPRASIGAVDARSEITTPETTATDDVLIGTEAVLHRVGPDDGVGLVAFLELDQELLAPRARAAEQALWLLVRGARLFEGRRRTTGALLLQTRLPEHEVVRAACESNAMLVVDAERARRQALGYPPFGGVAEVSGAAAAVDAACDALRARPGVAVLGPVDRPAAPGQSRALIQAATVAELCDALADSGLDGARARGRLRVDVDPRRV